MSFYYAFLFASTLEPFWWVWNLSPSITTPSSDYRNSIPLQPSKMVGSAGFEPAVSSDLRPPEEVQARLPRLEA